MRQLFLSLICVALTTAPALADGYVSSGGGGGSPPISIPGQVGTVTWSEPNLSGGYYKVMLIFNGYANASPMTITYASPFHTQALVTTNQPGVGLTVGLTSVTISTCNSTINGAVVIEGF